MSIKKIYNHDIIPARFGKGFYADNGPVTLHVINQIVDEINAAIPIPNYKVYTALVSQTGITFDNTNVVVLENTLGGTIVLTYNSPGNYIGTLSGAFPEEKTWFPLQSGYPGGLRFGWNNINSMYLQTFDSAGNASNNLLYNTPIEIRVYN